MVVVLSDSVRGSIKVAAVLRKVVIVTRVGAFGTSTYIDSVVAVDEISVAVVIVSSIAMLHGVEVEGTGSCWGSIGSFGSPCVGNEYDTAPSSSITMLSGL